jgi:hypothetical protein
MQPRAPGIQRLIKSEFKPTMTSPLIIPPEVTFSEVSAKQLRLSAPNANTTRPNPVILRKRNLARLILESTTHDSLLEAWRK